LEEGTTNLMVQSLILKGLWLRTTGKSTLKGKLCIKRSKVPNQKTRRLERPLKRKGKLDGREELLPPQRGRILMGASLG